MKTASAFREYVERGMQLINNGIISAKQTQYEVTGSISIACLTYAPILLPCINEYSALNPYINFSVMQTKYAQSWQEERNSYDFVLISGGMDSAPPPKTNNFGFLSRCLRTMVILSSRRSIHYTISCPNQAAVSTLKACAMRILSACRETM